MLVRQSRRTKLRRDAAGTLHDTRTARRMSLDPEDAKLVTLARSARCGRRTHAGITEGAAVRDTDGRTYAAATVENADPALTVTALRAAVAAAASSGVRTFEAAALVTDATRSTCEISHFSPNSVRRSRSCSPTPSGTVKDRDSA